MGDPYVECRFECETGIYMNQSFKIPNILGFKIFNHIDNDCDIRKACIQNKCQDPCIGTCGINALCNVERHVPVCSCPDGWIGNAFVRCQPKPEGIKTMN